RHPPRGDRRDPVFGFIEKEERLRAIARSLRLSAKRAQGRAVSHTDGPTIKFKKTPGSGRFGSLPLLVAVNEEELVLVHFVARPRPLARIHLASTSILILIELLLLFGREQRTDLRRSAGDDRLHFLHGLPMDLSDLWLGLIN